METIERVLRSDWCVYPGGAIYLENTDHISIIDCEISQVGGNGITISRFNEYARIEGCYIHDSGASSVLLIGDSDAVRSPLFSYEDVFQSGEEVDWQPGPKSEAYPRNCHVINNLMIRSGRYEKQSAGVCISIARDILVKNNTIYEVPRSGINICDGTWGGHDIA